jgi:hypothetical protein
MPHESVLTRQLIVILSLWLCVWGMAAVDCFDLTDDVLRSLTALDQLVEPELDDEETPGLSAAVAAVMPPLPQVEHDGARSMSSVSAVSTRPRYQQLAQYRI